MVNQILTQSAVVDHKIEKVPTSRAEIFKSTQLGMIEKRVMMQFVKSCLSDTDDTFADLLKNEEQRQLSFKQFIDTKNLPGIVSNYLTNAVAMSADAKTSVVEGLKQTKKFLNSVARFGDSPFLFSLYGVGELPQSFCRLASVFGAVYHLKLTLDSFCVDEETHL
jgi:Rab proteins geranylgeranyltransferase component A